MAELDSESFSKLLGQFDDSVKISYASTRADGTHVIVIDFSEKGFGFGEIAFYQTSDGLFLDTECMSKERVMHFLKKLVDSAILDTDNDPDRHLRYNEVRGRRCGVGCNVCNPEGDNA